MAVKVSLDFEIIISDKNLKNRVVVLNNKKNIPSEFASIAATQNFECAEKNLLHIPSEENIWLLGAEKCLNYVNLGSFLLKSLQGKKIDELSIDITNLNKKESYDFLSGFLLRNYIFDKYKKADEKQIVHFKTLSINSALTKEDIKFLQNEASCIHEVRSLVNTTPIDLYPKTMAEKLESWLSPLGVKVKILKGKDLEGMNLLTGVGQASEKEPYVVVMEWMPNGSEPLTALVGKGVTYDCGGLSIKMKDMMPTMKCDMAGSAVVAGTIANLAKNGIKKNVVGIVGLVENMISGNAIRPDDVITSLSGKTVEISNTDAEGRLVLADLLEYVQRTYKPTDIVDLATLTGAIVIALGHVYAGVFSNSDKLSEALVKSGTQANELLWRMPLHKAYDDGLASDIADMNNMATPVTGAGSAVAASFLKRFIHEGVNWAHIDIAGVAFLSYEDFASTKGATGYGVKMLTEFLKNYKN